MLRKKTFETLTHKKTKKKKKNEGEGIERGIKEEEDKALKNCDLIPICF